MGTMRMIALIEGRKCFEASPYFWFKVHLSGRLFEEIDNASCYGNEIYEVDWINGLLMGLLGWVKNYYNNMCDVLANMLGAMPERIFERIEVLSQ